MMELKLLNKEIKLLKKHCAASLCNDFQTQACQKHEDLDDSLSKLVKLLWSCGCRVNKRGETFFTDCTLICYSCIAQNRK